MVPWKIISIVIAVVLITGGAYFLGTNSSNGGKDSPKVSQEEPAKDEKANLEEVLEKLKKKFTTITETKIYTEANDPNTDLGKPGKYQEGAAFRDSRARENESSTLSETPALDWGTDEGGSIEVYANDEDAKKRVEYLEAFQSSGNSILNPGAFEQVGNVVIRISTYLSNSQQQELINFIKGEL